MISAYLKSDVGKVRRTNEDACAVSSVEECVSEWQGTLADVGGWALLADGMGGHVGGEVAAGVAIAIMRAVMPSLRTEHDVGTAITTTNTALYLAMKRAPELKGMGTTLAGLVLLEGHALAFNLGDSRIYQLNRSGLSQVSIDDSEGHFLTQCLGGSQVQVPLEPHVVRLPLRPGTTMLLCSDGLTEMISDAKIAELLDQTESDPAADLIEAALAAGGHDNVSAIVIRA
jgi:serine/threonine protein phosphatase PrpC